MWCSRSPGWGRAAERVYVWAVLHVSKGWIRGISSCGETRIECQTEQITEEKSRCYQGNNCIILMRALVQGKDMWKNSLCQKNFIRDSLYRLLCLLPLAKVRFLRALNVLEMLPLLQEPLISVRRGWIFFRFS